jgi:hypothetical protein
VDAVAPGGEVVALDSAGFGSNVTISKSVSITASPGVYAGITVFSGDGIQIINAGVFDSVVLRGLTVINQGSTGFGISCLSLINLHIENCVISGFSSATGIGFGVPGNLEVKDSIIRGNKAGIALGATSGFQMASATIDHVRLQENLMYGLIAQSDSRVTVTNCVASGNGTGFAAQAETSASVDLNIESSVASNNNNGISAKSVSGVPTVRVSSSIITNNTTGLLNFGSPAIITSRGNNTVEGNGMDTSGTIGSYSAK